jgi:hypothetical protein
MSDVIDEKLGYYIVNGLKFNSKIKAAIYSVQCRKHMQWYFNDDIFDKHNWAYEPNETLDELYDARSRELREQYDYIILSYSGGSDSHNILESFIRQGLHIDEIVVNNMNKATDKFTELDVNNKSNTNAAAEFYLQTVPRLKEVQNLIPNTKIKILDLTDHLFKSLENVGDASWILNKKEQANIAGMTRFNYIYFNDIRKNFDKGKRIAIVVGLEKPRTYIDKGEFFLVFNDRAANIITVAEHMKEYPNSSVELFYWTPNKTGLNIITKQVHVIKKWLEAFPEKQKLWKKETLTPEMFRMVHEKILRNLIYTTWNDNWYQADKAVQDWYSEFDQWFFKHYSDTKTFQIWMEGINYVTNAANEYIRYTDNKPDGLYNCLKHYKIGKIKEIQ